MVCVVGEGRQLAINFDYVVASTVACHGVTGRRPSGYGVAITTWPARDTVAGKWVASGARFEGVFPATGNLILFRLCLSLCLFALQQNTEQHTEQQIQQIPHTSHHLVTYRLSLYIFLLEKLLVQKSRANTSSLMAFCFSKT